MRWSSSPDTTRNSVARPPDLPDPPADRSGWPWNADEPATSDGPDANLESWPRITVVTPSFDQAEFLEEAIRSVILQGYPNLEYFVVDGGSDDGSVEIIRRYEGCITNWVSEPDEGQSHAIEKGFAEATGDVLAWLNSDDRLRPGALRAAAEAFREDPELGLVFGKSAICDEAGALTGIVVGRPYDAERMVRGENCVAQPSAFFSRSAYLQAGGIDRSLHFAMDMDLWLRIGLSAGVAFRDAVWSDFRWHAASKTGQRGLGFLEETVRLVRAAFASGKMTADLRELQADVMSGLEIALAHACHARGRDRDAREHAMRGVRIRPAGLLQPSRLRRVAQCMMGHRFVRAIKRLGGRS